jgi:hypothetical protein
VKTLLRKALVVLAVAAQAACGDSSETTRELRMEDLAGHWTATAIRVTDLATSETEEWLSAGYLFEFTMTLDASGNLMFTAIAEAGGDPVVSPGTLELEGQDIHIRLEYGVLVGTLTLEDGKLTIDIPDDEGLRTVMEFHRA